MFSSRGISLITGAALIALIALICGLAINGLLQLQTLGEEIKMVVEHHNRKIFLITETQVAAHRRTDSLFRLALANDAFERDAHFLEFNRAGFQVGSGRNAIRQMGFNPEEERRFEAQSRLVANIELTQERVIDLFKAERNAQAYQVLKEEAIPVQQAFNRQLAEMRALYHQANLNAQRKAQETYRRTFLVTLIFGVTATALALLITWLTLQKVNQKSRQLQDQMVELECSRAALHREATHDSLTGLANRRMFYDRLQQAIRHTQRYGGKVGILYVDLNHFKEINDNHGHQVGDAVLTEVAKRLTSSIRDSDTVARLGGDEFVVLLEGVQAREDFLAAAHKIERELNAKTGFYGLDVEISASIGLALYPDDGKDEDTLIRVADAAMYRVKSGYDSDRQCHLPFSGA